MTVETIYTTARTWCSVLLETDEMASAPASIDLMGMLVNFIQPSIVVEAGTYRGHLALAVANILRAHEHGTIYTADTVDNFSGTLAHITELQPFVRWYHGDYLDMLAEIEGEIDLAYIDASSKQDSRLRLTHAERTFERLRPGGLLVADDTASTDWQEGEVFRDWAKCTGIHLSQHRGLTIIQKPI
jgi:predicted O-methyltransferase YrrM